MALRNTWAWLIGLAWAGTAGAADPAPEIFVQTGHSAHSTMVRFSPNGQRLVSCDGAGEVIAWNAGSGRQFRSLFQHTGMCLGLAFTPEGQRVVSAGGARNGNDVVMSQLADGQVVQHWPGGPGTAGHISQVRDVAATLDARGAWSLGEADGLKRWALGSAAPVSSLATGLPGDDRTQPVLNARMVLSADQRTAWVARTDGSVLLVPLAAEAAPTLLLTLPETISAMALSPDGRWLALARGSLMGSGSPDVLLVDATSGQTVRRLTGHAGNVFALAFSADSQQLASAAQIDLTAMINGGMKTVAQHEALRVWRVADGALLAEARNQRNDNGTPFVRGSLDFSAPPAGAPTDTPQRLALALWDEAVRVYDTPAAPTTSATGQTPLLQLVHTLEGRGIAPRQLQASDHTGRLLVADGRPRVALKNETLSAQDVRREFGEAADWTPERVARLQQVYAGRGVSSSVQRASMWNLATGRMEHTLDWHRGTGADLGLDAQGRFTSVAPLFPQTVMLAPLKTRLVRQATADADGQITLKHFAYEPGDGPPGEIFASPATGNNPPQTTAYSTELVIQSPAQRWTAVAGVPAQSSPEAAASPLPHRVFVLQQLANGTRAHRHDLAMPGKVLAMAVSADERTLWVSGTTRGLPHSMAHQGWLMAVHLATGQVTRQWALAEGVTVSRVVAHPAGQLAITNGGSHLSVWDARQDARKFFIQASNSLRPVRALALSADGLAIAAADTAGWTTLWDWPANAAPKPRWHQQLAAPGPDLLHFWGQQQRLAAGAADGSVRLLRRADGAEMARMIRFDNNEWITLIPEGYFVASQEGDRWVNVRMGDQVYGIEQFYDVFYRPDIVERRLASQPIGPLVSVTLQDAVQQPPPRVSLEVVPTVPTAAPASGQTVQVRLASVTQGGGVGEVRLLHNGKLVEVMNRAVLRSGLAPARPIAAATPTAASGGATVTRALRLAVQSGQGAAEARAPLDRLAQTFELELVPGENAFTVIGFNSAGNLNARPVTRSVIAAGVAAPPRVFVLAVGVDIFQNPGSAPSLQFAVKDATDFAAALRQRTESLGSLYRDAPVSVRVLQNQGATRSALLGALEDLKKEVRPNDLLVWFVASHGTLDQDAQYGIVLHDWDGRPNRDSLFSARSILEASRSIKAFNQLVVLDTCHAGGVSSLVSGLYDARMSVLARSLGLHVFASASATEQALDGYRNNGLFTHTLLQALGSRLADRNADRRITVNELGDFARRETMRIARGLKHKQEPLLLNFGKDIPVYDISSID